MSEPTFDFYKDIGRSYSDPEGVNPRFVLQPMEPIPCAAFPTHFKVHIDDQVVEQDILYSHLALLKLCKQCTFNTVLDIGTNHGNVANVLHRLGKQVTAIEPHPPNPQDLPIYYEAEYQRDYMEISFPKKFDAIWCSHVLEHIRNPGAFLDKMYDDLALGGVLALTVPYMDFSFHPSNFVIGHCNKYNDLSLIYNLICAGFDCRYASVRVYSGQISVLVRKNPTNLPRSNSAYSLLPQANPTLLHEKAYVAQEICEMFPVPVNADSFIGTFDGSNWGDPL